MKIAIGCDHGGLEHKNAIVEHLRSRNFEVLDFGIYEAHSVDYPEIAVKVSNSIVNKEALLGILVCGTGIGMSLAANKVKGIRCGHCHDVFSAKMTRLHNNANVLAFGERVVGPGLMIEIVDAFLNTDFSYDERHMRRVNKIIALEQENFK